MALQRGDHLPDLSLPAHDNEMVSLAEHAAGHPLVVVFFPLAFTSTCTEEMCTLGDDLSSYQALDARMVAISVDSPRALGRFRGECNADFPFLSDFNREASRAFGVLREAPLGPGLMNVSDRSAFVFDRDGRVVYAWHSVNPSLLPPFDEIKGALQEL
ncbi:MAG: peroxiredoxin [Gemmatimonadota bacterium]|jgi:peroxiredoxin|nr:peroxiredoxin [Gemmatimonadota bacterium]